VVSSLEVRRPGAGRDFGGLSFFVDNPINRYAISAWMPLQRNSELLDRSLDPA
jgi:hypothetical protein